MAKGKKGSGSQAVVPTRAEQWRDHNLNSNERKDLTSLEKQVKRIEWLRSMGVSEEELTLVHVVSPDKANQDNGGPIDMLNIEGAGVITIWNHERRCFYYLLIDGNGSKQSLGDMRAISQYIEQRLKPRLLNIHQRIKRLGGRPFYPPRCFAIDVEEFRKPVPPKRRRH